MDFLKDPRFMALGSRPANTLSMGTLGRGAQNWIVTWRTQCIVVPTTKSSLGLLYLKDIHVYFVYQCILHIFKRPQIEGTISVRFLKKNHIFIFQREYYCSLNYFVQMRFCAKSKYFRKYTHGKRVLTHQMLSLNLQILLLIIQSTSKHSWHTFYQPFPVIQTIVYHEVSMDVMRFFFHVYILYILNW